jgi:hypothetical protein
MTNLYVRCINTSVRAACRSSEHLVSLEASDIWGDGFEQFIDAHHPSMTNH